MREEQTLAASQSRPGPLPVVLTVRGAEAAPATCNLSDGSLIIGAGDAADVVISDSLVSRKHAQVRLVPEGVEVTDLGSRNGTFYLGSRVHRVVLAPNSAFSVGSAMISIEPDPDQLETPSERQKVAYRGLMGRSPAMLELFSKLWRLEGSLVNVLIGGESGVGKELIANAVHQGSALCDAPLVVVNCAALGGDLVRSELFGHRRGSFTGAVESRVGALEQADGGTLFLDEIGELPLEVQPMLLRALETGDVQRLGEQQVRHVKVRVLAATHRDLRLLADRGEFREDLYYRLAVVALKVPPLRERPEDVPALAEHFARLEGAPNLPAELIDEMLRREWRGNVRELRNAVQSYLALGTMEAAPWNPGVNEALSNVLRRMVSLDRPFQEQKQEVADAFGRVYFDALLKRCGGSRGDAARMIGMDRSYFGKLLARYGLAKGGESPDES